MSEGLIVFGCFIELTGRLIHPWNACSVGRQTHQRIDGEVIRSASVFAETRTLCQ